MIATTFGAHVAHPQLHSNAPMHSPVSPPAWAVATRVPYRSPPSTRPPHHLLLDHHHRGAPRRAPCRCIRTVRRRQRQPPVQPEPPQHNRSRCSCCLSPSSAGWSATGRRTVPHTRGASTAVSALGLESCCTDSTDSIDSTRTSRSRGEEDVGSCRRSSGPASKRRRLSRRLSRRWFRRGWCRRGWCRRLA